MAHLTFDYSREIPGDQAPFIVHNTDNTVHMYTRVNNKYMLFAGELELGLWENLTFPLEEIACLDTQASVLSGKSYPEEVTVFVWKDGNSHRIAVIPDDSPLYAPTSVHRLYWGTDTKRMYQNIADTWQMVGTLHHDELDETGQYSHEEIDTILQQLTKQVMELQSKLR